ncbi:hypothetical protein [Castellaniella sp.]|uniref:hypothetical protein n=1 Tax=Castellaniella sp. TaxID=1955812 RepID=UPI003C78276D
MSAQFSDHRSFEIIKVNAYSSRAARSFKSFIGELTAVAAGLHVGIHEVIPIIEANDVADPWKAMAEKHGVVVDGLRSQKIIQSTARLNVVSLYSGFDLFLEEVRDDFFRLNGRPWVQHDGDGPFTSLARNTLSRPEVHTARLGKHRIAAMDYYRLVRNAIAHPSKDSLEKAKEYYDKNAELLDQARVEYGMQSAPNSINQLSFHDVKLLAQVGLALTKAIDAELDPGDERLFVMLELKQSDLTHSSQRKRNAWIGKLRTDYGVSVARAEGILDKFLAH